MNNLLLIDDDQDFSEFFVAAINSKGANCQVLSEPKKIINLNLEAIDHIIIDLLMPEFDGLQILRFLKEIDYRGDISVTSGQDQSLLDSAKEICQLHKLSFHSVLKKPFDLSTLDTITKKKCVEQIKNNKIAPTEPSDSELTTALKTAIDSQCLDVYFQPKVNMSNSLITGFEALARWSLNGKFIPPTRFIPLAESTGLINKLTQVIVEKSLKHFARIQAHHSKPSLSINFSALELNTSNLPDLLKSKIDQYQVASERITLEITETVFLEKNTLSLEVLTRLRLMGFKLSIDDFGAGYSSVNMLQNGPFTELKIDRAFVSTIHCNEQSRIIVQSIVEMAKRLELSVVAEGIEDKITQDGLTKMNCLIGQGYFFSKPMPAHLVNDWLTNWYKNNNLTTIN
jgi:EAL domain-containing protein (putative c-di-GMP-specific phosphodiesterase class I)/ActR/RegA family two-component response regulator